MGFGRAISGDNSTWVITSTKITARDPAADQRASWWTPSIDHVARFPLPVALSRAELGILILLAVVIAILNGFIHNTVIAVAVMVGAIGIAAVPIVQNRRGQPDVTISATINRSDNPSTYRSVRDLAGDLTALSRRGDVFVDADRIIWTAVHQPRLASRFAKSVHALRVAADQYDFLTGKAEHGDSNAAKLSTVRNRMRNEAARLEALTVTNYTSNV